MAAHSLTTIKTLAGMRCFLELAASSSVGLVPTMGALHVGHLSLIERARQANQIVIVSIFVNPLQFSLHEDLAQYPRQFEQDQLLCQQAGVDAIFAPTVDILFPDGTEQGTRVVPPSAMIQVLCGRSRLGHFEGVATIVARLLHLVQPQRAYFGQKDAQQLAILRRMVTDLNFPVQIVACPIVREASGLAYSSRNQYLSDRQRQQATRLNQSLQAAQQAFQQGDRLARSLIDSVEKILSQDPDLSPEYLELVDPLTLNPLETIDQVGILAIAVRLGATRLIDNTLLDARKPILAIDGPAGAGKSTVTRICAQALGLLYLDTGAMYRAVTWLVQQSGISLQDRVAIAELVSQSQIQLIPDPQVGLRVRIDGQDVTQTIRSLEVTANVSEIAAQPAVRQALVQQQQTYGRQGGVAMEGRDIGTNVFPEAGLKIFLTASVQERAQRRQQQLQQQGIPEVDLAQIARDIGERDYRDSHRIHAPLRQAEDAIAIDTDKLTIKEVAQQIINLYRSRFPTSSRNQSES
ncbi:MAG: bifunctional pantoate--beta-alanine ligase/(d)CMP kinase [Aphanocapsa sp. GSE-SYN-MK-11-07L]|jgi:pantoate ligase/cytidylate kinase|nr:bifunctional pantoate--beta-alanine ligase/(d)CMP kinase [Aphanocapsa sp. GSE-SYN-MK-11-07L]